MPEVDVTFCSCPASHAAELARTLVSEGLAACVNIVAGVQSVYRWQGEVRQDNENLLIIKAARSRYPALQTRLLELHPYELPEILAVPVRDGLPGYLDWVNDSHS